MKNKNIQTKRQFKTGLRKLQARVSTRAGRKQRVTASNTVLDSDVPNPSIGRALTLILILHLVALGVIFVGFKWNKGQFDTILPLTTEDKSAVANNGNDTLRAEIMHAGDTYEIFAERHQVDTEQLRQLNDNALPHAGKTLLLPPESVMVKPVIPSKISGKLEQNPSVAAVFTKEINGGESEVMPPRAVIVEPADAKVLDSGVSYEVQAGDSVWRISNKFGVSQDALMKINGMSNPRQLRSGSTLKIPVK